LEGAADTADGCAAIQKDPNRMEKRADKDLIKFNRWNCQVLHLGGSNPKHQDGLASNSWEVALQRRTSGPW